MDRKDFLRSIGGLFLAPLAAPLLKDLIPEGRKPIDALLDSKPAYFSHFAMMIPAGAYKDANGRPVPHIKYGNFTWEDESRTKVKWIEDDQSKRHCTPHLERTLLSL